MNVLEFLVRLRDCDIQIRAEGDRLRCNAPAGALTAEDRERLRQHKDEILKFLRSAESFAQQPQAIVPLQPHGSGIPIYAVAGHNGDVFCFRALARHLGPEQPLFGLQPPGLDGTRAPLERVEDLAAYFAAQIRAFQPNRSCLVAGYCAGGTIAFELARQLVQQGATVRMLALFGSPFPTWYRSVPQLGERLRQTIERVVRHTRALAALSARERRQYVGERLRNRQADRAAEQRGALDPVMVWRDRVGRATLTAIRRYQPGAFSGRLALFWPAPHVGGSALTQWPAIAASTEKYFGPEECNGANMLREPHAAVFAGLFRSALQGAPDSPTSLSEPSPETSARSNVPPPSFQPGLDSPMHPEGNTA